MKHDLIYMKLGDVCDFQGGSQPPKDEWIKEAKDGYVRMLQIRDFTQSRDFEIEYIKHSKSTKYCKEDDILLARYGASVGKVLWGKSGAYNVAIMKTIPNEHLVSKAYIRYYFQSRYFQTNLLSLSAGRAAQAGFSKDDIKDFIIPTPPLTEQKEICSLLDKLNLLIEKKKEQVAELDNLAQSLFYDMFGDPVVNEKKWNRATVNDVTDKITDGSHTPPKGIDFSDYRMISSQNITDNGIVLHNLRYLTKVDFETEDKRTNVKSGDVLLTIVGTVGRACVLKASDGRFVLQRSVAVISPKTSMDSTFLKHFFIQSRSELEKESHGIAQKGIYLRQLASFPIIVPPLPLQQEFAKKVYAIELQKKIINMSIKDVQTLLDAKMDYYFGE